MTFNPQTPQSPSQFSPSTADPLSSMNSSMTSVTTVSLPTPAHSVNACDSSHDINMTDADSPNKRKRLAEDSGDHEQKKVHIEDPRRLGIENLHLDVGPKYLLLRTPHSASFARTSEDLFERFGLAGIAAEVARTKPNGEKNALRKTFKGQIKSLGISGSFDPVRKELDDPEGLMHMLAAPEDGWFVHEVTGKEIQRGFSDQVLASLSRATTMAKGPIAKQVWDSSVLGDLAPAVAKKTKDDLSKLGASTPAAQATGTTKPNNLQVPQADRMRRNGKKRSYQDSSFEGYGDGFPDDDLGAETGYSTGEGDDRSAKKRRKQNPGIASSLGGGIRQAVR
ncbi:Rox3 mediator complex subunit [Seiridium cupressi]|uniref:Mediator of RNA polymerase II transcription subunit 19 n=1 Tax=Seiridium unicorne TaxID=138068 RepID=A0ABR2V196_9PEZI